MNIFITGGNGFIGYALVTEFLNQNHCVIVMDLIPYKKSKFCNYFFTTSNFLYIEQKVNDLSWVDNPALANVDLFIHLAAQTSSRVSEENPELDINTNLFGGYCAARFIEKQTPKMTIFSSSMAVYEVTKRKINEDFKLLPSSLYGVTKVAAENIFEKLSRNGHNITVLRLFNVYGPGQDYRNMIQGMLSIYLAQAIIDKNIYVTGGLNRYRDFIYIDDIVNIFNRVIEKRPNGFNVFNVGTGKKTSVKDLIALIISSLKDSDITIEEGPSHPGDVFGTYSDSSKALEILEWKPLVDLNTGIRKTVIDAKKFLQR